MDQRKMENKITLQEIKDHVLDDLNKMIEKRRAILEKLEKLRDDVNGDNLFKVLCDRYCPNDDFGLNVHCCGIFDGTGCDKCWKGVFESINLETGEIGNESKKEN